MNFRSGDFRLIGVLTEVSAIIAFIFLFYTVPSGADKSIIALNLAVFYVLFIRSLRSTERIIPTIKTPLSFETLFLFMSYLIFYHNYQLYLFGLSDLTGRPRYIGYSFIDGSNAGITLATVGLLAFTIGYRAVPRAANQVPLESLPSAGKKSAKPSTYLNGMSLATTGLLLALIFLYLIQGWRSAGEGRYMGTTSTDAGVEGVYVATSMLCMIIAALWVYTRMRNYARPMILSAGIVLALIWCLRLAAFGDRNVVQLVAMAAAGGYYTLVKRPSRIGIVVVVLFALYMYGVIEIARELPDWYTPGNLLLLIQNPEFLEALLHQYSFNLTTITLRATVEGVPATYDYLYGQGKILSILSIIPFAGKVLRPYLAPDYISSPQVIQDLMVGSRGVNLGTNIISDPYSDFSVPGVLLTLFALGVFAKLIRNMVVKDPNSLLRVVLYVVCLALYSQMPRYSIESLFRPVAWTLLLALTVRMLAQGPRAASSHTGRQRAESVAPSRQRTKEPTLR
jgi:oligosaccharide repeat unit polymerase